MSRTGDRHLAGAASRAARELNRTHSDCFGDVPVRPSRLARRLGIRVVTNSAIDGRARLELGGVAAAPTIHIASGVDRDVARFALAHELGHFWLLRSGDTALPMSLRERFADAFARELLVSDEVRRRYRDDFRRADEPRALVALASAVGLSIHALLVTAELEPSWIGGLDRVWLRVKFAPNRFTGREPKLRVASAHCDRTRFFVPTNQGLTRVVGDLSWLGSLLPGRTATVAGPVTIKVRRPEPGGRYADDTRGAHLIALRLRASAHDQQAYFLVCANLSD